MHRKTWFAAAICLPLVLSMAALVMTCSGCGSDAPLVAAPSSLTAVPLSDTEVHLSWVVNSTNEDGLRIYRDDGPATAFQEIGTVPASWVGYLDAAVTYGTFHTYYVVAFIGDTEGGTATSGGNDTLEDTTKSWDADEWVDATITIITGTGQGQLRVVTANTATTVTVDADWDTNPDATSQYFLTLGVGTESPHSNTVTQEAVAPYVDIPDPTSGEVLDLGYEFYEISWTTNMYILDARIQLSLNDGATWPITLQPSWLPNGSPWMWKVGYKNTEEDPTKAPIWEQVTKAEVGTATGSSNNTLEDTGQSWNADAWIGATIAITMGTGTGQSRVVTANTATTITVDVDWVTNPDTTSQYYLTQLGLTSTETQCKIRITDYTLGIPANGSTETFTINVP